jgi:hypothetical protein
MCGFEEFFDETSRYELDKDIEWEPIYPMDIFYSDLLKEYKFTTLVKKTDMERLRKAQEEVRTRPPIAIDMGKGKEKLEFNFKASPSKEGKRHKGYLVHKDGKVVELYCNCADFFYRLWHPFFKKGFAVYNPMLKYGRYDPRIHAPSYDKKHNQEPPEVRNPDGKLYVCKHLAALKEYL